jgi:hypothetical protein
VIALAQVVRRFEADYRQRYPQHLSAERARALQAIKHCRSTLSAHLVAACPDCDARQLMPHSCGHRSCPHCQHFECEQWLERQRRLRVPAEYFLLTFTLPGELRALARHHARNVYGALFAAAWATVQRFCRNDRQLKGEAGAVAVLHTHSRRLDLHPHVHLVMPGASLDARSRRWRTRRGYLFSHKALARVFRGTLLAAFKQAGLKLPAALPEAWVVDCKRVGNGDKALVYLGRYLYRGVIGEADILTCDHEHDGQVSFRYRDGQSGQTKVRTLPGADFLHLILQHVLPRGFRRSRNYGFLHPNSKGLIALLHIVLRMAPRPAPITARRPAFACPCCGAPMKVIRRRVAPPGASARPTSGADTETAV